MRSSRPAELRNGDTMQPAFKDKVLYRSATSTHVHTGHENAFPVARRSEFLLNTLAITILTLGYTLTTGTSFLDGEAAKIAFRVFAIFLILLNIVSAGKIVPFALAFTLLCIALMSINGNAFILNLIFLTLFFESFRRMPLRDTALALLISSAATVAFHQIGLILGIFSITETEYGGRLRSAMGFTNPNQLAVIYLSFVICSLFFHITRRSWRTFFLFAASLAFSLSMLRISDSRTSTLAITIMLVIYTLWRLLSHTKGASIAFRLTACFVLLFANASTWFMTTAQGGALNDLLSARPLMIQLYLSSAGFSGYLIGWQAPEGGVDNSYIIMLSTMGLLSYSVFTIALFVAVFRSSPEFSPIYLTLMIVGLFEGTLMRPEIPAALLFLIVVLIRPRIDAPAPRSRK